jgi:hypothetical protein
MPKGPKGGELTASQNSPNRSRCFSCGLLASAEFTAPIELPAAQSGSQIGFGERLIAPGLVGAERAVSSRDRSGTQVNN